MSQFRAFSDSGSLLCRQCGNELLVAFSCKKRGVCPSCNARRMCGAAAHLVDRAFPSVPGFSWLIRVIGAWLGPNGFVFGADDFNQNVRRLIDVDALWGELARLRDE